jgi:hypothetical protein
MRTLPNTVLAATAMPIDYLPPDILGWLVCNAATRCFLPILLLALPAAPFFMTWI